MANYGDYKYIIEEIKSKFKKGFIAFKNKISMGGNRIEDVGDPINSKDAINMSYANSQFVNKYADDNIRGNKNFKDPVKFTNDVIIEGNLEVSGVEMVGKFVTLDGDDEVAGKKTFVDKTIFDGEVDTYSIVSLNGITNVNNKLKINDDMSILNGIATFGDRVFFDKFVEFKGGTNVGTGGGSGGDSIGLVGDQTAYGTKTFEDKIIANKIEVDDLSVNISKFNNLATFNGKVDFEHNVDFNNEVEMSDKLSVNKLEVNNNMSILSGIATFNDEAIFNHDVIFNADDGLGDRYVSLTGTNNIYGYKTFNDLTKFKEDIFLSDNISVVDDRLFLHSTHISSNGIHTNRLFTNNLLLENVNNIEDIDFKRKVSFNNLEVNNTSEFNDKVTMNDSLIIENDLSVERIDTVSIVVGDLFVENPIEFNEKVSVNELEFKQDTTINKKIVFNSPIEINGGHNLSFSEGSVITPTNVEGNLYFHKDKTDDTSGNELPVSAFQDDDSRIFYGVRRKVFRAGTTDNEQWGIEKQGDYSFGFGENVLAQGNHSISMGKNTEASKTGSIAMGDNSKATGDNSLSIGKDNISNNTKSIALGSDITSSGEKSIAIGDSVSATKIGSIAIGNNANSTQLRGIAIGNNVPINAINGVNIGYNNTGANFVLGNNNTGFAFGEKNLGNGIKFGKSNAAYDITSTAIGFNNYNNGLFTSAVGYSNSTISNHSIILGTQNNDKSDNKSLVIGYKNESNTSYNIRGTGSIIIGDSNETVTGRNKILGNGNKVFTTNIGQGGMLFGDSNESYTGSNFAMGALNKLDGQSIAVGFLNESNNMGITIGLENVVDYKGVAIGNNITSSGNYAVTFNCGSGSVENSTDNSFRVMNATSIGGNQNWTNTSDRRIKRNINELKSEVENIKELIPVSFIKRDSRDDRTKVGFIAQDMQKVYPEVVNEDGDGLLSIEYASLVSPLTKALQEVINRLEKIEDIVYNGKYRNL